MKIVVYNTLSPYAKEIRDKVFVQEQGFVNEFDDVDSKALHIVMFDDALPVAVCRVFQSENEGVFVLGRLAVIKEYRGRSLGSLLVNEAVKAVKDNNGKCVILHAQCRVKGFYNKLGFCEYGDIEDDEGCPHIWMKKCI